MSEGDVYRVPLVTAGFGLMVWTRGLPKKRAIFASFFRAVEPSGNGLFRLAAADAVWRSRMAWPRKAPWERLGVVEGWDRELWPSPVGVSLSGRAALLYDDDDPMQLVDSISVARDEARRLLVPVPGAGSLNVANLDGPPGAEITLTRLLRER